MEDYYWNDKFVYLSKTRWLYYNDVYLNFLISSVWNINKPVRIIDFGCGYGYLGTKLMSLLPMGSTYTGIDAGDKLIDEARETFRNAPFQTEFILGDIQEMDINKTYDVVVCHAFLLHMDNPKAILQKMIDSSVDRGRIICFEPHWISSMASYHLEGHALSDIVQLGFLQELYERDAQRSGRDGNIGIKLPIYLSQLGVRQIECRVSDRVNFLDPNSDFEKNSVLYNSLKEDGFGADPGEVEPFIKNLVDRGAALEEAQKEHRLESALSVAFNNDVFLSYAPSMKITSGIIER
ncbi:class I SAM-dependent methyltransferase [Paenibacillus glycanilyticus]|uniref:class I SAM-dependent methyltransferase n=1 Tax=Paenibacillus glycanilyticus TaxID=126569 RepID=UPI001910FD9A|nr:class I SAM-dependent methyltransferase [Paenibacillus glycanilyticus]